MAKIKPLTKVKKKQITETNTKVNTEYKGVPFKDILYAKAPFDTLAGSILQLPSILTSMLENTVANYIKVGADEIKIKADNNNIIVVLKDQIFAGKNKTHLSIEMNKKTVFNRFI